jgi:hypothetical protein
MWIVGDIAVGDKRVLPNISISIIAESPTNDNQSRLNERLKKCTPIAVQPSGERHDRHYQRTFSSRHKRG